MTYSILNDREIRALCVDTDTPMISPFVDTRLDEVRAPISFGVSSFGYDVTLAPIFDYLDPTLVPEDGVLDPLTFDPTWLRRVEADSFIIPAGGFVLGHTAETFMIPQDVVTICMGKSTWARCALITNVTPFEPGWVGQATMELSNTSALPLRVYAGLGIAQLLFFRGNRPEITYSDRKGKYQGQRGITPALKG